jgi:Tfp pilus assembly PilM family ATPase/Tfp pilus assembly protein PilN
MFALSSSVGIDFRSNGLAMVHLQRTLQGCVIRHSSIRTFPPDAEAEGIYEMASLEIQNFFRRNHIRTDQVRVGIPRREAMVRLISLPEAARENLHQVMQYEIDRYLPFGVDELFFDHHVMGPGRRPRTIRVMLVAVRKDRVEWYMKVLDKAHVRPAAIEISSTALVNASAHSTGDESKPFILVDVGDSGIEVNAVAGRNLVFSRFAACPDHGISGCVQEELDKALAQLQEEMQKPVPLPSPVVFSGKDSLEEIIQGLNGRTEFNFILASPPGKFLSSKGEVRRPFQLAAAVGLARGGLYRTPLSINLLPRSAEGQAARLSKRLTKVLIVLAVLAGLLWQGGRLVSQRLELQRIGKDIEQLKPSAEATFQLRQKAEKIGHQIQVLTHEVNKKQGSLTILRELTNLVPTSAWLSQFDYDEKKLVITGYAESASGLIPVLEASPLLEKVKFSAPINMDPYVHKERFQIESEMTK